jgi:hypothetical protein
MTMTEFNPFSSTEPAPEQSEVPDEPAGNRKPLVMVGALAVVALGAGAFLFLGGSADEEEFVPVARAPRAPAAAAAAPPAATAKLPVASKVTLGRNPFRALYVQPAGGDAPAAVKSGVTAIAAPAASAPAPVAPVVGAPAASSGGSTFVPPATQPAPAPAQPAQSTVALKAVTAGKNGANPTGTFVYDGTEVVGAPGDVMSGKLLVISLQQDATGAWFANLQLGDGSPFEVHERQTVVVQ